MGWPFSGKDGMIEKIWLPLVHGDGEKWLPFLVNGKLSSMAFLSAYRDLPPIEQMPEKEKGEMEQFIDGLFQEKTQEEKIDACKIIYTIGTLL